MNLKGLVVVVTGAGAGLGRACAERVAADGAAVVIADIDGDRAESVADAVTGAGGEAIAVPTDVSDEASVDNLVAGTMSWRGRVDALVNNAGIFPRVPWLEMKLADWNRVVGTNLGGTFLCSRAVTRSMKERRSGRIVNFASTTLWLGSKDLAHYMASKGGIIGLTRALAVELGEYGVTVNCVVPGLTPTEGLAPNLPEAVFEEYAKQQCLDRVSVPGDVAGLVAFLCSQDAAFLTGQTIMVNGGRVLR